MAKNKFELSDVTKKINGVTLYRIRALRTIGIGTTKANDLGGWIEKESNLSQRGSSWVHDNAQVYGDARVFGDAQVFGRAKVYGNAKVYGSNAQVYGNAVVNGNAKVYGNAWVHDNAQVYGDAEVNGRAEVNGDAWVYGNAKVYGNAVVNGDAQVRGHKVIKENIGDIDMPTPTKSFRELIETINNISSHGHVGSPPTARGERKFAASLEYPIKVRGKTDRASPGKGADDVVNARKAKQTKMHSNNVPGERSIIKQGSSYVSHKKNITTESNKSIEAAYRAARRKEYEKDFGKFEPNDQMIGTAKVTKDTPPNYLQPSNKISQEKKKLDAMWKASSRRNLKKQGGIPRTPFALYSKEKTNEDVSEDISDVVVDLSKIMKNGTSGKATFRDGDTTTVGVFTAKKMMKAYNKLNTDNAKKFRETINSSAAGFLRMMKFSDKESK